MDGKNYLYNDFQWEIIFRILSKEKHFNLVIDKEKQTIDNVDEKVVSNILSKNYMKGSNLDVLKSMFNMVLIHHTDDSDNSDSFKLPYLDSSIINLLNSFRLASLKDTAEGYALFSNFKSINDMVVIKTARDIRDNMSILYEYFIGTIGINKLRSLIPNFAYTLAIFKCNPLPIKKDKSININDFCVYKKDNMFYVIYEKIPGDSLDAFIRKIKNKKDIERLISYLIQVSLALQVAQQEIDFVHYDLHTENIILRKLSEPIVVEYTINDSVYKIETDAIPTIIDYGFSHFVYKGAQFGIIDMQKLGINSTKTAKGYDIYKLFLFTLNAVFRIHNKLFEYISWILIYFSNKKDTYTDSINSAIKDSNWSKLDELLIYGWDKYYSILPESNILYNSEPINFINWIEDTHPEKYKKFVRVLKTEFNEPMNKLLDGYRAKMEGRRIFRTDLMDEIKDCSILDTDNKSYIINKYIIGEFQTILDNFGLYIKDKAVLKNKIMKLDTKTERNKWKYTRNDDELLKIYENELSSVSSNIDIDNYTEKINRVQNIMDIKRLSHKMEVLVNYIETYSNYKMFIDYSKLSTRITIDGYLEDFYYSSKDLYKSFSKIKSEYVFNTFRIYLETINSAIYNFKKKENIHPEHWIVDDKLVKAIRIVQNVLQDIRLFYNDISYACDTIEKFVLRVITTIGKYKDIYLYVPPRSLSQIQQVYFCEPNKLSILFMKWMNKPFDNTSIIEISNFINLLINKGKNDLDIYNTIKSSIYMPDKNLLSKVRLQELNFLFTYSQLKKLKSEKEFMYLNLEKEDTTSHDIGKHLNLGKDNIVNIVREGKKMEIDGVSYVTINETGIFPFSDNIFSLITAFQSLHEVEDIDTRLQEISRVVKKGGILLIREYDVQDDCTKMIADIEHSLIELVESNKISSENSYYYLSINRWNEKIKHYGFEFVMNTNYDTVYNTTNSYYAMYVKK